MRLVCPRCGAQYEIDDSAIPANGRDVECSACDHVWRATRPDVGFDPTERPKLNRPLSDSVIEILREEAARELEVRAAEREATREAERAAQLARAVAAEPVTEPAVEETPDTAIAPQAAALPLTEPPVADPTPDSGDSGDNTPPPARVAANLSAITAAKARRRFDAGYHLAVMIAVVAVALYALAPRMAEQGAFGQQLMEWRTQIDQGRDWLQDRGNALLGKGT